MSIKLTILVENTVSQRHLHGEHGLACWIEAGERRFLFDTGQSELILQNAEHLGIDLASAEAIVLSHGHYDHTGGLAAVLERTGKLPVYAHPDVRRESFSGATRETLRPVGMPAASRQALDNSATFKDTQDVTKLAPGLFVSGEIPRVSEFEDTGGHFWHDAECRRPDMIADDQALLADTPEGVVVVLGCAHAGLVNTLLHVGRILPERPIRAVVGGLHLGRADAIRLTRTIDALRAWPETLFVPQHCTGFAAATALWNAFPGRVMVCPTGGRLEF